MCDLADKKKYIHLENILNKINQKYIALPAHEVKRNANILEQVTELMICRMKKKDILFRSMFERTFYGGSYYDGLKVGKPEEYDLDYVLNLPALSYPCVEESDKPGFVFVKILESEKFLLKRTRRYGQLNLLIDKEKYLCTDKALQWMEKVICSAISKYKRENGKYCFHMDFDNSSSQTIEALLTKCHPAFTLNIRNEENTTRLDIDLVTCFQFTDKQWPKDYKVNPIPARKNFLIVPKKPYGMEKHPRIGRYWRLSFQEQERCLMRGGQKKALKPSIKLIKKLRDTLNHRIASYFIKTVFLWEIEKHMNDNFWNQSLSFVFMKMLETYHSMIQMKSIPYYWNENYNMIGHLKEATLKDISNTLRNVINEVHRKFDDPFTIAKYLVESSDVEALKSEVDLGKRFFQKMARLKTPCTSCCEFCDAENKSQENAANLN